MKLNRNQIEQIRKDFKEVKSKWDFFILIQKVNSLQKDSAKIHFKDFLFFSHPFNKKNKYISFEVPKKSGGTRIIHSPSAELRNIQHCVNIIIQCIFEPANSVFGFVKNKSIADNAKLHIGNNYVFNIDLKDFFSSIDQARVWACLRLKPFDLNDKIKHTAENIDWESFKKSYFDNPNTIEFKKDEITSISQANSKLGIIWYTENLDFYKNKFVVFFNCTLQSKLDNPAKGTIRIMNDQPIESRLDIANIIANLCCTEIDVDRFDATGNLIRIKKSVLPQGAPTSPVLSNVVCQRLDLILKGVAKRFGLKYSRYADDITFSSMYNVYQKGGDFINEIQRIIKEQGFRINESKTRLQKAGFRQEVTGLVVNEKVNVNKRYIKQLRQWIHYLEKYDYQTAESFFRKQYRNDKGHVKTYDFPSLICVLEGKLNYLKMVKGGTNSTYKTLAKRFNDANYGIKWYTEIIKVWEKDGIEAAKNINFPKKVKNNSKLLIESNSGNSDNGPFITQLIEIASDIQIPNNLKKRTLSLIDAELNNLTSYQEKFKQNKAFISFFELYQTGKFKLAPILEKEEISKGEFVSFVSRPKVHNPSNTAKYLINFARRDTKTKWFTHAKDGGEFDYEEMITKNLKDSSTIESYDINKGLWYQLNNFLYENSKFSWRIDLKNASKFSWSNEEVKRWCEINPGVYPNHMPLPEEFKIKDLGIYYFGDLIKYFKHSIQFRNDDKAKTFDFKIKDLLLKELDTDFDIYFTEHYKKNSRLINAFTDVNAFLLTVKQILKWIQDNKLKSHEIKIDLREEVSFWEFVIEHQEGYIEKSIEHFLNPKDGDLGKIRDYLFQNSDFNIEARFLDGSFKLIVLEKENSSDKDEKLNYSVSNCASVKYVFKLYK